MSDLVGGLYPKQKHENAPDFVIGKLSINVVQFREWMKAHLSANPGLDWINIDMKISREGKGYAALDTWKPGDEKPAAKKPAADDFDDKRLPF